MADVKISALPAASTPLAGTEVVPLVQSSTTKNVSVANLTAGRSVSANDLTLSGGTANGVLYLNGSKVAASGSALTFDATNLGLGVTPGAWNSSIFKVFQIFGGGVVSGSNGQVNFSQNWVSESGGDKYISTAAASIYAQVGGEHFWYTAPSGTAGNPVSFTERLKISNSGNVTVSAGNLVVGTAGKGIDFSANTHAAGMTSELLNWYEEGTFTPTYGGSTTNPTVTYSEQVGRYTRIGRVVTIGIRLVVTSATGGSGNLIVNGLPFTGLANTGGLSLQFVLGFGSNVLQGALSGTSLILYDTYAGTSNTQSPVSALTSAGGTTYFVLGGTYMV